MGLFLIHLEPIIKYVDTPLYLAQKLYPIPDQNGQSLYPFSDQNGAKNHTLWGSTYLHGLYKGVALGDWMQGWQYSKGLFYLRPIFRLTKLAFLRASPATLKGNAAPEIWI